MNGKKYINLPLVIINVLAALIWIAVCIKEFATGSMEGSHVLIAVVWTIAAGIWSCGYLKMKRKK